MTELFLKLMNLSISAGWLVLAVVVLRVLLKNAPKWLHVVLWSLVGVRLAVPFSLESAYSLQPSAQAIPDGIMLDSEPAIHTGVSALNTVVNPILLESFAPAPGASVNPLQIWMPLLAGIWAAGVVLMLAYTAWSYWRLCRRVQIAIRVRENIFESEAVSTPFVLGLFRPCIYLPIGLSEQDAAYVIAHEQAHLVRRDHWWKPLGFALLTVYWCNPVLWIAYALFCRDIELACDERVIGTLETTQRADYSEALLHCSIPRRWIYACPLAFGEVGVKKRVQYVLNYKKPAFWLIVAAVVSCVVLAVGFLTDPPELEINDIFESEDYAVLWQTSHYMTLEIPKEALPDRIYTAEGHMFEENEVIAYQTDTSTIWLESIQLANEGDDQLYFAFNFSYDLPEMGVALTPYWFNEDNSYAHDVRLQSRALTDDKMAYEDALGVRGYGPSERFAFYVSTDACKAAVGTMKIKASCVETVYEKTFRGEKKQLTLDDLVRLSKKGKTLSWEDFQSYSYNETGMGLYIRAYEINEMFCFMIAGVPGEHVNYMHLSANDIPAAYIDVRVDDVEAFIEEHQNNPVVKNCSASWSTNPVGYSEGSFTKMLELGGYPEDLARSSEQTIPVVRIKSIEELDAFIRQMDGHMDFKKTYPDCFSFMEEADRYYESGYFDENTLFMLYVTEATDADRLGMEQICTVGSALMLNISREVHQDAEAGTEGWLIPVSIANTDLTKVTEVQARVSVNRFYDRETEKMYQFEESADLFKPTVLLMNDGTFQFSFSSYSSYYGIGAFELKNDRLALYTDDGKYTYVFDVTENAIVFDADASSEMLWYSDLYDGAVLRLQ